MGSTIASFATWLATKNPLALGTFLALNALAWWLVVLAHELGHAAVGLARTQGLVVVRVGSPEPRFRRRFGRLQLELAPLPLFGGGGEAAVYARYGRTARVVSVLAGPAAGSAASALLIFLGRRFEFLPLVIIGWFTLAANLANLIPFRFRGVRSDGAGLLEALRGRSPKVWAGDDLIAAIASRWFVLTTDVRGAFAPRDRDICARLIHKMRSARAVGDKQAMAIHQLTFRGWCWRRAEEGDTAPLREPVLDARHRATREGLSRANIIAAAAEDLIRAEVDFEDSSPTPESLERGFRLACEDSRYGALPEHEARTAFCFGVAMHDVATIAG